MYFILQIEALPHPLPIFSGPYNSVCSAIKKKMPGPLDFWL